MHGENMKLIGNMCLCTFSFVRLCSRDVKIHHVQHWI